MAGTALTPYFDPWSGEALKDLSPNLAPFKEKALGAGRMAGRAARLTGEILGPIAAADVAVNAMNPLKMDKAGYEAYGNKLGGMANVVPPAMLGAVANMFGVAPNSWNPAKQWKNNLIAAKDDFVNSFGGANRQAIPTAPIKGDSAYEGFDDQYISFATANKRDRDNAAVMAGFSPSERIGLAMRRGDMGEPMFDNSSIAAGGYDRPEVKNANVYDPKIARGMPGMNPATGVGGSAIGAGLRAAAARGDWDAVGRYYASQGQPFAGKMYGGGGYDDLMRLALGGDGRIVATKKRDRAAALLNARLAADTQLGTAGMQTAETRYRSNILGRAEENKAKDAALKMGILFDAKQSATKQAELKNLQAQLGTQAGTAWFMQQPKEVQNSIMARFGALESAAPALPVVNATPDITGIYEQQLLDDEQEFGRADGGLITSFADGGPIAPPNQNPMGTFGQPPAMQSLDPAVREYGQYVHAATMNGLQPVPFGKFINLLASARQQMQTLPTTGGQYGFAGGGAVPVAGRQVLGPGGPRDDAIPAVIDGTQPAALSNGEFVMPTDVTQYWGTAKLQQMIDKARGQ